MKAERTLITTCGLIVLACAGASLADGGMFFRRSPYNQQADIFQPTQKVYIRWDGSQERLLIQTKYEGPAEEMVWIVPVPSEPAVVAADGTIFEELSDKTDWPDIACTEFAGLWPPSFGIDPPISGGTWSASGGSAVVQWRQKIGDYDVVLLRPVGGEDVIAWLNANDFAIPETINPILEDYVSDGWWMVASKIHPDALTSITQEKLAKGTLHPLELTFQSPECVYPLRLTRMAAGPVEELIYIEGPAHYVPLTLSEGDWQIDILGGPIRQVPLHYYQSDVEQAIEAREGRTRTKVEPHLTKLRRVFQPEEMTEDIFFTRMDYSNWLATGDPLLIGQAATQYGRHRDPNGVPFLLAALSSGILEQVQPTPGEYQNGWLSPAARILSKDALYHWMAYWVTNRGESPERLSPIGDHVFSVTWALGEIAVEHDTTNEVEEMLLECARHDNQLVRMEAYLALTKLGSPELGAILVDRLAYIPENGSGISSWNRDFVNMTAEMNMVADWIVRFGTIEQKDALAKALTAPLEKLYYATPYSHVNPEQTTSIGDWFEWVVWQAARAQQASLVAPLHTLRTRLESNKQTDAALQFVLRAEAACGSDEAIDAVVDRIVADEARTLAEGNGPTPEGMASLSSFYVPTWSIVTPKSLRVRILHKYWLRHNLYPMSSEFSDAVLRSALSANEFSDWYTLYLLAGIKQPQDEDREQLMRMWNRSDRWLRLVVVDVLYVREDGETLLSLYETAESDELRSEIAWALAVLGVPQAVAIVEEQTRGSWNADWLDCGRTFLVRTWEDDGVGDPNFTEAMRKAEAIQAFFLPEREDLDDGRLAALKRLCDNSAIHPGLRVGLLATAYGRTDYSRTDWGRPLLMKAVRELLEAHPRSSVVSTITANVPGLFPFAVDIPVVVGACGESDSDDFHRTLMVNLLAGGNVYLLPVIEGLLREVWPQRYIETQGQSPLFREPGDLAISLDYYCLHAQYTRGRDRNGGFSAYRPTEPMLASLVEDNSLPAGYRAFLLVHWPTAPSWIPREFVEALLEEEMPEFIREALQQRLANWN